MEKDQWKKAEQEIDREGEDEDEGEENDENL